MQLLANVDVPDLEAAARFYCDALGLAVGRRLGAGAVELVGASALLYLLEKPAGSPAARTVAQPRDYSRHWTPVHMDFVVVGIEGAVRRAVAAGATLERETRAEDWGKIAELADPFGHGFCLIEFTERGYDAIVAP
jgi:catechol 2,3-dioxygenase-like lactoylglutathione lyase family enzyme